MRETWRWFGDYDAFTLDEVAQTGAEGIVTALHQIPYGEIWPRDAIAARRAQIEAAGFTWDVVESLPVHEDIKLGAGGLTRLFANYRQSLVNLAAEGVRTVCYNFMPVLDWTRTDLSAPVQRGGTCLRFSAAKMAAFEIHLLGRRSARDTYTPQAVDTGDRWFRAASSDDHATLLHAIMSGLPGAVSRYDIDGLRAVLDTYQGVAHADLRANLGRFLHEVAPTAAEHGLRLCIHPDDPPRDILGLPRIVSTKADIEWIMAAEDDPVNGLTLCCGSLGARSDNDLADIARSFSDRIHFAHLRNVRRDPDGSFEESAHLDGDVDLIIVIKELLATEALRKVEIPYRADHGHTLLSDAGKEFQPGYSLIGRLRGLAELRGVIKGIHRIGSNSVSGET